MPGQDVIPLAPLPTPSGGDSGKGSAELAAELLTSIAPQPAAIAPAGTPPEPPKEPPKEATKAPPAEPSKPAPAAPAPKPAPVPVDINPDDPKVPAADLRKELKRVRESSTLTLREKENQIRDLNTKLEDFSKKRIWSDDDLKLQEQATRRLAQLESELYSRDYAQSPEYKTKYQDRLDSVWAEASEEVKGLTVKYQDGVDGDNQPIMKERPASTKDLMAVIDAPVVDRLNIAKKLFGEDKEPVLQWAREVAAIRKEAGKAIEEKRNGYASEITKRQQEMATTNQNVSKFIQETTQALEKQFPDLFTAPVDQPEIADALKKGFAFVDDSAANMMTFDVNKRAATAAVVRCMAGAYPRLVMERAKMQEQIKTLQETLSKYESSDPSELGGGGGGGSDRNGPNDGGTAEMAKEFDNFPK